MVLKTVICSSILLLVLAACTSGPAPVRDTVTTPATQDKPSIQSDQLPKITPLIDKPHLAPVPLSSKLKQQAEHSLQSNHWEQAILFAERGLRINRKEPFFYWVLSTAYQQLSEIQQSIDFARQGLRYASNNSRLKTQLTALVSQ